nr:7171_t:CDS:2 [Entrophospora candida]
MSKCNSCNNNSFYYNLCLTCGFRKAFNEDHERNRGGFGFGNPYYCFYDNSQNSAPPGNLNLQKENEELKKEIGEKRLELDKIKQALGQKQSDLGLSELKQYLCLEQTENRKLREKVTELGKKVYSLEKELLERKLIDHKSELNNLLIVIKGKSKMEQKELLDDLLEAQVELVKFNNVFIQKQLEKTKNKLTSSSEISEKEIKAILQKQQEITKLEIQMERFPFSRIKLTSSTTNEGDSLLYSAIDCDLKII